LYEEFKAEEKAVGSHGFVVPCIHRIPFQQALLEYLGEMSLFQALYDSREDLNRLIHLLDQQMMDIIHRLAQTELRYIEFGDNLIERFGYISERVEEHPLMVREG